MSARTPALLAIDLQQLDVSPKHGLLAQVGPEIQRACLAHMDRVVLPNVRRLQDAFRARGLEVIHVRIQSLTRDGRDRGAGHKRLGLHAAPGSPEAEFLPEVAPVGDEIVINKTASGVFNATNLHWVLQNLGVGALYLTGVYTDECVTSAALGACDLGYATTVVDDGCAALTDERHRVALATLRDRYARVVSTDAAVAEIAALSPSPS